MKKRQRDYDDHDVVDMLVELIESAMAETPIGSGPNIRVQAERGKDYLTEDASLELKIGSQRFRITVHERMGPYR